ncbi:MAG TPA: DHA2 family efflux MFS transporter permease subunit [Rhizomicrobium sp.]|jgi:DHA2 family multidrug resistance protein|nr:DHA2 family efflux MFS transporter permease subunit [Rhizomicrobium sp.]
MSAAGKDRGWTPERSVAGGRNPWSIVAVISIATFMVVLDTSIANVALAHIAGSLSASYDEATWVVTSFLVANAVIIPISGWLADVVGRKRYYMISVALFTGASLLCGLAPNLGFLIVARVLQGIGGGGLTPVEQSMLADTFPPSKRALAFAAYGFVVITAPILGPTLGGWITDNYSWHWVFLINVPIGLLSLALVSVFVDEPKALRDRAAELRKGGLSIDYVGFAFVALWLGCMEVTLDRGQREDWFASPTITVTAVVAALSFVALIPWELMRKDPVVNVHLFRRRNFVIASALLMVLGVIVFGSTQFIPQLLQEVLGYTATNAGLALTSGGVATIVAMPLVGVLSSRVDLRYLIGFGLGMQVIAFWYMGHLSTQMAFENAAFARLLQAAGLPFLFIPITTIAYVGLKPEENNQASALMNVMRNLGGTIGISTVQTLLARGEQIHQSRLVENLNPLNPNYVQATSRAAQALGGQGASASGATLGNLYQSVQQQAAMLSYVDVFYLLMIVVICTLPLLLVMEKGRASGTMEGGA